MKMRRFSHCTGRLVTGLLLLAVLAACGNTNSETSENASAALTAAEASMSQETSQDDAYTAEPSGAAAPAETEAEPPVWELKDALGKNAREVADWFEGSGYDFFTTDSFDVIYGKDDLVLDVRSNQPEFSVFGFLPGASMPDYAPYLDQDGWVFVEAVKWIRDYGEGGENQDMETLVFEKDGSQVAFSFEGVHTGLTAVSVEGISKEGVIYEIGPETAEKYDFISCFSYLLEQARRLEG